MLVIAHVDNIVTEDREFFSVVVGIELRGIRNVHREVELLGMAGDRELTDKLEVLVNRLLFDELEIHIDAVKAVEIGEGVSASKMRGSENNDSMGAAYAGVNLSADNPALDGAGERSNLNGGIFDEYKGEADEACCGSNSDEKFGFASNHAGGTLGGMTSGQEVVIKTHFKPTPSIFLSQPTQNLRGEDVVCELRGRHDPCIGVRGSVVATAMARLVAADMLLLNLSANLANLKKIYDKYNK